MPAPFYGNDQATFTSLTDPTPVTFTATATFTSSLIAAITNNYRLNVGALNAVFASLRIGMPITDSNGRIPAGTTINGWDVNAGTVMISNQVTSAGAVNCTCGGTGIMMSTGSGRLPAFVHVSAAAFVSTGTRSVGTPVRPAEDVEWTWNFGDSGSTETITDPRTGVARLANSEQIGHQAVYVYRNVGTGSYIITLTGRYMTASGIQTIVRTATYLVAPYIPAHQVWADSVNGNDANNGSSQALAVKTITRLNAVTAQSSINFTKDWQINLASGSHFTDSGIVIANFVNGWRIVPYGAGANPIVATPNGNAAINTGTSGANYAKNDLVVSNIVFMTAPGSTANGLISDGSSATIGTLTTNCYHYYDNCTVNCTENIANTQTGFGTSGASETAVGKGFWNCTIKATIFECQCQGQIIAGNLFNVTSIQSGLTVPIVAGMVLTSSADSITFSANIKIVSPATVNPDGTGTYNITAHAATTAVQSWFLGGQGAHGHFGGATYFGSFVGCSYEGPDAIGDNAFNHHIYPECQAHQIFKWCNFGKSGSRGANGCQRNFSINYNLQGTVEGGNDNNGYHLISECAFGLTPDPVSGQGGTRNWHDFSDANNSVLNTSAFNNFVVERNFASNFTAAGLINLNSGFSYTFRDNRMTNLTGGQILGINGGLAAVFEPSVYRNLMYLPASQGNFFAKWPARTLGPGGTFGPTFTGSDAVNPCEMSILADGMPAGTKFFFSGAPLPSGVLTGKSNPYWVIAQLHGFTSGGTFSSPGQNNIIGTTLTVKGIAISSMSYSTGIVTAAVTGNGHGLSIGQSVNIDGALPAGYNGRFTVLTTPTPLAFTFALGSDPGGAMTTPGNFVVGTLKAGHTIGGTTVGGGNVPTQEIVLSQSSGVTGAQGAYTVSVSATAPLNAGSGGTMSFAANAFTFSTTKGGSPFVNSGSPITSESSQAVTTIITSPMSFFGNTFMDQRSQPYVLLLSDVAQFDASGGNSYIQSNSYSAPLGSTSWWQDGVSGFLSKATWQGDGFDGGANFTTSAPLGWTIPPASWNDFSVSAPTIFILKT